MKTPYSHLFSMFISLDSSPDKLFYFFFIHPMWNIILFRIVIFIEQITGLKGVYPIFVTWNLSSGEKSIEKRFLRIYFVRFHQRTASVAIKDFASRNEYRRIFFISRFYMAVCCSEIKCTIFSETRSKPRAIEISKSIRFSFRGANYKPALCCTQREAESTDFETDYSITSRRETRLVHDVLSIAINIAFYSWSRKNFRLNCIIIVKTMRRRARWNFRTTIVGLQINLCTVEI